jgi:hypothetical protein
MHASYPYLRQFIPNVLAAIAFQGGPGTADLMAAVAILKKLNTGGGRKVPEDALAPVRRPVNYLYTPEQWRPRQAAFCTLVGKPAAAADALDQGKEDCTPRWRSWRRPWPARRRTTPERFGWTAMTSW